MKFFTKSRSFVMLILLAMLPTVFACSPITRQYMVDSTLILAESSTLRNHYEDVEALLRLVQKEKAMFTESEWSSLTSVDANIDMLIMKFDHITRFDTSMMSTSDVTFLYSLAVQSYREGREVVQNHWVEFKPSTQLRLRNFDTLATDTSKDISKLLEDPTNENINKALTLTASVVTLALKVLATAAL